VSARRKAILSEPHAWLHTAVRYLARWDRTAAQVEQFLKNKGASPGQVRRTIARLAELKYLDDGAYAQRWLENRLVRKPMGREGLRIELQAKGVTQALANEVIREALRGIDEETLARRALQVGCKRKGRLAPAQAIHLLRQRGFEDETIDRIIESWA
jgi:regulatory protein